ncbi:MAG: cupin domain-containing protein [Candidatus Cyclobacteriaceae bacterium M3_2C_046]
MKESAEFWINHLNLNKHPEGGYFREVYRGEQIIPENTLSAGYQGPRNVSTSIYFLLEGKDFSAFHRIKSDETWHFYVGSALEIYQLEDTNRNYSKIVLGTEVLNQQQLQYTIPRNHWFAARVVDPDGFSLVGCTVAPGFDFADFELAESGQLIKHFPQQEALIVRLTR